jgi:hypothetical protein
MIHAIPFDGKVFASSPGGKWISRAIKKPRVAAGPCPKPPDGDAQRARYQPALRDIPPIRRELVNRVRAEIARGTYDTAEKIAAILAPLAQDLRL